MGFSTWLRLMLPGWMALSKRAVFLLPGFCGLLLMRLLLPMRTALLAVLSLVDVLCVAVALRVLGSLGLVVRRLVRLPAMLLIRWVERVYVS